MMKELYTITEFAKLRNINVNSLRYYERLGVFEPERIDEYTGYRYYSLKQLPDLDFVLMCIDLGIPIKELPKYCSCDGHLQIGELMKQGYAQLKLQLAEYQSRLQRVEKALEYIENNQPYVHKDGVYTKHFASRTVMTVPAPKAAPGELGMEKALAEIYRKAEAARLLPLYPVGLLIRGRDYDTGLYIFTGVVGDIDKVKDVIVLPEGEYICTQVDVTPQLDILSEAERLRGDNKEPVIVENIFYSEYSPNASRSELQMLIR